MRVPQSVGRFAFSVLLGTSAVAALCADARADEGVTLREGDILVVGNSLERVDPRSKAVTRLHDNGGNGVAVTGPRTLFTSTGPIVRVDLDTGQLINLTREIHPPSQSFGRIAALSDGALVVVAMDFVDGQIVGSSLVRLDIDPPRFTTVATGLPVVKGVAVGPGDRVHFTVTGSVRRVLPGGATEIVSTGGLLANVDDLTVAPDGTIYVVDGDAGGGRARVVAIEDGEQRLVDSGIPYDRFSSIAIEGDGGVIVAVNTLPNRAVLRIPSREVVVGGPPFGDIHALTVVPPSRRPVVVVPGIAGTYAAAKGGDDGPWTFERGIAPSEIRIDPLGRVYDNLLETLRNVGYVDGQTLFVVNYDWRLPPGPIDAAIDGRIDGLTGASISDTTYQYAVDYLGRTLRDASLAWAQANGGQELDAVDMIVHSTGGLVARTYLQSAAHRDVFEGERKLPAIENLIMIGVPNRGASKAWNPLNDNWVGDLAYQVVLSKIVNRAYQKVAFHGALVSGPPQAIDRASILDPLDRPEPTRFIDAYVPTIRSLLATYAFLKEDGDFETVNDRPEWRNALVLDLNDGLDLRPTADPSPFANLCKTTVIYGRGEPTATTVIKRTGPAAGIVGLKSIARFQDLLPRNAVPGEDWYDDVFVIANGDGTVPLESSIGQFVGDDRVELVPFMSTGGDVGSADHTGLCSNERVLRHVLTTLGVSFDPDDIPTSSAGTNYTIVASTAGGSFLSVDFDPVDGFVVDGLGRRLGYSEATGSLSEIPGSVWTGGPAGLGLVFGPVTPPLELRLTGRGEPHDVRVGVRLPSASGALSDVGDLALGATRTLPIPLVDAPVHDFAVLAIKAPRRVRVRGAGASTTKPVRVKIANRGRETVEIADAETLALAVQFAALSTGACSDPSVTPVLPRRFPLRMRPGRRLTLRYRVTFDCAADPAKSTRNAPHEDVTYVAFANVARASGHTDTSPSDDLLRSARGTDIVIR